MRGCAHGETGASPGLSRAQVAPVLTQGFCPSHGLALVCGASREGLFGVGPGPVRGGQGLPAMGSRRDPAPGEGERKPGRRR